MYHTALTDNIIVCVCVSLFNFDKSVVLLMLKR